jgi:hypothetical protein
MNKRAVNFTARHFFILSKEELLFVCKLRRRLAFSIRSRSLRYPLVPKTNSHIERLCQFYKKDMTPDYAAGRTTKL